MAFQNRMQQEVHGRVGAWLAELYGSTVKALADGAGYRVPFGSASVEVSVSAWGEGEAVVVARAAVVTGATMSAELMRELLRKNCETRFGAFGVTPGGDVEYRHSVVGSTCQKEEVKASVQYVMLVADLSDDEIVRTWGGHRALDRPG
jgi:Putative bacterial sensory transduction regulator